MFSIIKEDVASAEPICLSEYVIQRERQRMAIAIELKRIICLMLCGQMQVDRFRAERTRLLERFKTIYGMST